MALLFYPLHPPSEYGSRRNYIYPPTPQSLYPSRSNRPDATQSSDTGRKSSPAENKALHGEEQRADATESKSPYNKARNYMERLNFWNEAKTLSSPASDEVNSYEEPFSLSMSFGDWLKLSDDLKIFETDQRFGIPF